ncbi:MAG: VTT domain-containing protein [Euryarchaeota archaeon]|nr:VTT domain-containing protein [Euryarchaeota archaeon]MBU4339616.1 VTT domain-containing protein [Euryarchaeota archaeon]MBU4453709.1 VTT domain-containing protein [Euryarchaeota archaeon]MCG2736616.1 VTT domain-containing protein [Candidatus Methanoperedenaceae archaeon]
MAIFELFVSYGMIGLFAIGILSSIIPIPTEPVVLGLLEVGENPELVFIVLITGSILGASMGYLAGKYELRRFIPFQDAEKEKKVQKYFREYGGLLLLVSPWIPIVGDLAPIVAGIENYEPRRFIIVISAAKIIKGIGIIYLSIKVIDWWTLFLK